MTLYAVDQLIADDEAELRTAYLRQAGFRSDPVRMYPDEWQTFVSLVRAMHRGQVDAGVVAPVLAEIGVDVADVALDAPPFVEFDSEVDGYDIVLTWQGSVVPSEFVRWTFSDGTVVTWAGTEPFTHSFPPADGVVWCQVDLSLAENVWSETGHWQLPDDPEETGPPPADPPPATVPTMSNTKAEIVAWLLDHGVTLSESALMALTKDELIDLVADLQDVP